MERVLETIVKGVFELPAKNTDKFNKKATAFLQWPSFYNV
jgi:hypothetical protein